MGNGEGKLAVRSRASQASRDGAVVIHNIAANAGCIPVLRNRKAHRAAARIRPLIRGRRDVIRRHFALSRRVDGGSSGLRYSQIRQTRSRNSHVVLSHGLRLNRLYLLNHRQGITKGRDRVSSLVDNALFRLSTGIIRPDAEHGADRIADRAAREGSLVKSTGLSSIALRISLAQHPVIAAIGVDQPEALIGKVRSGHWGIIAPAVRPVADDDIRIKRAAGDVAIKIDTVVERHRGHASGLDHSSQLVDIFHIRAVITRRLQVAEAHGATRIDIIRILVRAHVEELAALAGEVIDILLQQRLRERDSGGIRHVDRADRAIVGAVRHRQRGRRAQDRIHVTRCVDARNHPHALGLGIGDDRIHLGLRQLIDVKVIVLFVAGMNRRLDSLAAIRRPIHRQGHIVQQETQAVVAHRQLDIVKSSRRCIVDDLFDTINAVILTAAIQEHDVVLVGRIRTVRTRRIRRRECRHGQQAQQHDEYKNHGKHFLMHWSFPCLVHLLAIPFIFYFSHFPGAGKRPKAA